MDDRGQDAEAVPAPLGPHRLIVGRVGCPAGAPPQPVSTPGPRISARIKGSFAVGTRRRPRRLGQSWALFRPPGLGRVSPGARPCISRVSAPVARHLSPPKWRTTVPNHVLTGTPGAGKTAVLRLLEVRGYSVVEEAATDVIALGQALGRAEP
ncbi:AAA family ATPase, partial [Nonomuraea sp. NPDC001023]|uniref:AAA family ATPase n=1 Tax=Nonomuraea sp. NPDC001023 TaxID=3154770 RepID=UPI003324C814